MQRRFRGEQIEVARVLYAGSDYMRTLFGRFKSEICGDRRLDEKLLEFVNVYHLSYGQCLAAVRARRATKQPQARQRPSFR